MDFKLRDLNVIATTVKNCNQPAVKPLTDLVEIPLRLYTNHHGLRNPHKPPPLTRVVEFWLQGERKPGVSVAEVLKCKGRLPRLQNR